MNKSLMPFLANYDLALERLWRSSDGLSDEELNWNPSEDAWSIAQVHQHLLLSEKLSIQYLEKKLQYPFGLKKAGFKSWWNFNRLSWALQGPFKLKAPKPVAEVTSYMNRAELEKEWMDTRTRMKALLEAVPDEFVDTNLYKHPLAGKFSLVHMLRFFYIHITGHIKQVGRIRAAMN